MNISIPKDVLVSLVYSHVKEGIEKQINTTISKNFHIFYDSELHQYNKFGWYGWLDHEGKQYGFSWSNIGSISLEDSNEITQLLKNKLSGLKIKIKEKCKCDVKQILYKGCSCGGI